MTVNPLLPVSVSIAASANPVCSGTSVTFTATPVNGGTSPAYQWKVNGNNASGATNAGYSYVPVNGDIVTFDLTSNAICATGNPASSNTITLTVNPLLPVSVSIAASANPVCEGTPVNFTATPTNGGTSPAYQWKVNGNNASGATNATYAYNPANNDAVTCQLTSNAVCATGTPAASNTITMTVNPSLPAIVSIAPSANPVCAGTSVTFTATPTNGGTLPAYQWKINGINANGATNVTYDYIPANNDAATCQLTSNGVCVSGNPATSNTINMTVNPLVSVSVSIAASANPYCAGTGGVEFTATPTNGGASPLYQWKVNGNIISGATNRTYIYYSPANNDAVTCVMTSSTTCAANPATSNTLTMTVNYVIPTTPTAGTHVPSKTKIVWKWNAVPGATGYLWGTTFDQNDAMDVGTATSHEETGLTPNTPYIRFVWAINSCGVSPTAATLTSRTDLCEIGESFEGGIVFYIDETRQHGLIAAPTDQSSGTTWGCSGTVVGTSSSFGTGQANTTAIVTNGCAGPGTAARICDELILGGYNDWFLPSKDELNLMHNQKTAIGNMTYYYWSSSESTADAVWTQFFLTGQQVLNYKGYDYYVRAVRAF